MTSSQMGQCLIVSYIGVGRKAEVRCGANNTAERLRGIRAGHTIYI